MSRRSRKRKTLVIDASVICASKDSNARQASICFNFLETVRKCRHRVIFSPELDNELTRREKKKKISECSLSWRAAMFRAGLVDKRRITVMENLRSEIRSTKAGVTLCNSMHADEDVHLLEAALQTHKIVASMDDNARKCFASVCRQVRDIRDIMWVNHKDESEICCEWLKKGSPVERKHKLNAYRYTAER